MQQWHLDKGVEMFSGCAWYYEIVVGLFRVVSLFFLEYTAID